MITARNTFLSLILATSALFGASIFLTNTAHAASFNCESPSRLTTAERRICNSYTLSSMDERLDYWFCRAMERAKYFSDTRWIRKDQRRWLKQRNMCGTGFNCIRRAYKSRIRELKAYADHV